MKGFGGWAVLTTCSSGRHWSSHRGARPARSGSPFTVLQPGGRERGPWDRLQSRPAGPGGREPGQLCAPRPGPLLLPLDATEGERGRVRTRSMPAAEKDGVCRPWPSIVTTLSAMGVPRSTARSHGVVTVRVRSASQRLHLISDPLPGAEGETGAGEG